MKFFDALYVTYIVTDGMPDSVRREKMNMVARSFTGTSEPDEPKEQPEPNFATAWDDAAIKSIAENCFRFFFIDFDFGRPLNPCSACGVPYTSKKDALASDIRKMVKSVLRADPIPPCAILNRFEQTLVHSIAAAHRDYDHWNDK